jgi:hypothetical protein
MAQTMVFVVGEVTSPNTQGASFLLFVVGTTVDDKRVGDDWNAVLQLTNHSVTTDRRRKLLMVLLIFFFSFDIRFALV